MTPGYTETNGQGFIFGIVFHYIIICRYDITEQLISV